MRREGSGHCSNMSITSEDLSVAWLQADCLSEGGGGKVIGLTDSTLYDASSSIEAVCWPLFVLRIVLAERLGLGSVLIVHT